MSDSIRTQAVDLKRRLSTLQLPVAERATLLVWLEKLLDDIQAVVGKDCAINSTTQPDNFFGIMSDMLAAEPQPPSTIWDEPDSPIITLPSEEPDSKN